MHAVHSNLMASEFYLGIYTEVFDAKLCMIYAMLCEFWDSREAGKVTKKIVIFSDAHATLHHLCIDDVGPS
jgi:hypothetical protein